MNNETFKDSDPLIVIYYYYSLVDPSYVGSE